MEMAWRDHTLNREVAAIVRLLERRRLNNAGARRPATVARTPHPLRPVALRAPRGASPQR
jgi:hypothetical protein